MTTKMILKSDIKNCSTYAIIDPCILLAILCCNEVRKVSQEGELAITEMTEWRQSLGKLWTLRCQINK